MNWSGPLVAVQETTEPGKPVRETPSPDSLKELFSRITIAFGLLAAITGILGLFGLFFNITQLTSIYPGDKTIASSAALAWIFLGLVLAYQSARPMKGIPAAGMQLALTVIAIIELLEFYSTINGTHSFIESGFVAAGTALFGPSSSPVSPVAAGLIVLSVAGLILTINRHTGTPGPSWFPHAIGIDGLAVAIVGMTFALSYVYGSPLLYGTQIIPIAAISALAAFFMGAGIVAGAGTEAIPVKYLIGNSTSARLLRIFVPLVIAIILIENVVFTAIADWFDFHNAVLLSASLMVFVIITAFVIARVSRGLGYALERAEKALVQSNEELHTAYEEVTSIEEELRQSFDELERKEQDLRQSEQRLNRSQEIAHLGSWELDLVGNKLTWSDETYRIFGLVPQEFSATYEAFLEAVHPDDRAAVDAAFTGSIRDGDDSYEIAHRIVRGKNREIRHVYEKCEHVRNGTGRIVRSVGMVHDITERKFDQDILGLSHEILKASAESHDLSEMLNAYAHIVQDYTGCDSIGIRLLDESGNIPYFAHIGFTNEFELDSTLSIKADNGMCTNVIRGDTDPSLPFYTGAGSFYINATTKFLSTVSEEEKGSTRNICNKMGYESVALIPIKKSGKILGLIHLADHKVDMVPIESVSVLESVAVSMASPIQRVQAENHLLTSQQQNAFLADIVEHSSQPFGVGYTDGRLGIVNTAFETLTGYSREELAAMDWARVLTPPEWREIEQAELAELTRTGKPVRYEKEYLRKDGTRVPIELFVHYSPAGDGHEAYYYSFISDITERKRAEAELVRRNNELNHANEELSSIHEELRQTNDELVHRQHDLEESRANLKLKLDTILSPDYDVGEEELSNIINSDGIQGLLDDFYDLTRLTVAIIDLRGNILVATGWQEICTRFHRANPESCRNCIESDMYLTRNVKPGDYLMYKCRNNMWDVVTPIVIGGKHMGNLLTGQFFLEDEVPDIGLFTEQAERYGFDKEDYLAALGKVPRLNKEDIEKIMNFYSRFAEMISSLSFSNLKLAKTLLDARQSQEALSRKNEDLNAAYEEITATQEELRQNIDELTHREQELHDALAEKEVLLSEIHHRVKNNLTAFISLLSLEGSYEESPEGHNLKKDLQNRARSMALIHETLYRTKKYASVDMGVYLTTLIGQIESSYETAKSINTIVEADGVILDIARATPCGLIINELVTNAFKYAFPESFDCVKKRKEPCTIHISLARDEGNFILAISDNGVGLPATLDLKTTQSLGLKLVNFLAKHQLRANVAVTRNNGTEYIIRFREQTSGGRSP